MRVLQVINAFPPAWGTGGPAKIVYEFSKELTERGHEVTVYTTDVYNQNFRLKYKKNPINMDGIEVYHFKNLSNTLAWRNIPIGLGMKLALKKNIKDFDVVHAHLYRCFQAILVHHYAKKYDTPYILQPRGSIPRMRKGKQKKLFDTLFGYTIIKDADKIIASSKIESSQYRRVFSELEDEKIVHIPNGIGLETYQNLPKKGEFRKKYLIDEDEKVILFLSRIHERKGADILIDAFSKLKNELSRVKLVIAGPDENHLDKLKLIVSDIDIDDNVIFPGPLYEKDKLEAYVDADVFVLPSKDRYESFGNVVLEASMCGTPSVVTNVCGVSEWLDNIILVEPNVNSIKNSIEKGLKLKNLGKDARVEIKQRFSWDKITPKIEDIYQEIIKDR